MRDHMTIPTATLERNFAGDETVELCRFEHSHISVYAATRRYQSGGGPFQVFESRIKCRVTSSTCGQSYIAIYGTLELGIARPSV
jgi:hypothetical protein